MQSYLINLIIIDNDIFHEKIKLSGACGLSSALTCALVTVTTTVIHMSRLQALRECEYTRKTRTCTCYSIETNTIVDESNGNAGNSEEGKIIYEVTSQ